MSTPGSARADLPGIVNGPVIVVSALLASPAAVLLAQGMLTVTEMLTRFLLITAGCMVLWALARAVLVSLADRPGSAVVPEPAKTDDDAITGVVLDANAPIDLPPAPVDPDGLDMTPEELIELSLRKVHEGSA